MSINHTNTDNWDEHWSLLGNGMKLNPSRELRHRQVISLVGKNLDIKILDFGAGDGQLVKKLLDLGFNAVGWEQSQSGVSIANTQLLQSGYEESIFLVKDIKDKDVEKFDVIILSEVLEHLDQPALLLKDLKEYLSEGGHFVITVPSGPVTYFDRYIGHRRHYTAKSLKNTLIEAQLNPMIIRSVGFPVVNIVRILCIILGKKMPDFVKNSGSSKTPNFHFLFETVIRISSIGNPLGWQLICTAEESDRN